MARPFGYVIERFIETKVNPRYEAVLAAGYETAAFAGQPEAERLQCRNELDRTNWLGLVVKCQAAIGLGFGDELLDVPIRCTSNRMYFVTYNDALGRMFVLLDQAAVAQANWWRLKDAARAVTRALDLESIDLEAGWP